MAQPVSQGGIDYPDGGFSSGSGVFPVAGDLGELAARIGSPVTHNREGSVIFLETFEHGLAKWRKSESGTGAEAITSAARCRSGGYSAKLIGPTAGAGSTKIFRKFPYPTLGLYGLEFSALIKTGTQDLLWTLAYYDGVYEHNYTMKYMAAEEVIKIKGTSGTYTTLITGLDLEFTYSDFQTIKMVVDFPNDTFYRLIVNETEHDISAYPAYVFSETDSPNVRVDFQQRNVTDQAGYSHIDDVIVTMNEPER